jgi:alpha-glucuronidase
MFYPLDGQFDDNVIVQAKNGPLDFQIKEPVHPLFGRLRKTNQVIEFQITQEYTGQSTDVCFLGPMWQEVMNWKTYAPGVPSDRAGDVIKHLSPKPKLSGYVGVGGGGTDWNYCGHRLAQANIYLFGRLTWDNKLTPEQIAREWVDLTFHYLNEKDRDSIHYILRTSRETYRNYSLPLGGIMMISGSHYGVNIEQDEWNGWGVYNHANADGFGRDRTVKSGTGMTSQYNPEAAALFEDINTCPDDVIAWFHHTPFRHRLHNGQTVIQHIYDSHFAGYESVEEYIRIWNGLEGRVHEPDWSNVAVRLKRQRDSAREWRDVMNTYFYRHCRIGDEKASPNRPLFW